MLNSEINEFSVDSELTQVAQYFSIVENAIKTGDTNKRYNIATNSCEQSPVPFSLGSWCSVPLSSQGSNMVDLYNSFLTVKLDLGAFSNVSALNTDLPAAAKTAGFNYPGIWVGFKDSAQIVCQYQLIANGQAFYTQSFAVEEAYITSLATTEQVRKVDPYSRVCHEDVWFGRDLVKSGCSLNYATIRDSSGNYTQSQNNTIDLKIDIRRFLPLAAIKYIPAFIGNFQLRLRFGIDGLVCAPYGPEFVCGNKFNLAKSTMTGPITNKFVPFDELRKGNVYAIKSVSESSGAYTLTVAAITANLVSTPTIVECKSHLACFGLQHDVYNQLAAQYTDHALYYPIQTLTFNAMNGTFGGESASKTATITAVPRYVDSIFILFPYSNSHKTCYDNILAENYQIRMADYGTFPNDQHETWGPEFLEIASNVFNTNNDLTGFNKDVVKSLITQEQTSRGYESNDISNFILSIPTSTDNTFQQGQTSNTTINYQLVVNLYDEIVSGSHTNEFANRNEAHAVMAFLKDSVFAIHVQSDNSPPIVTLDEYDVTSPAQ